jgi:hypothetical protein
VAFGLVKSLWKTLNFAERPRVKWNQRNGIKTGSMRNQSVELVAEINALERVIRRYGFCRPEAVW